MTSLNLASVLREPARRQPDTVALIAEGRPHTYAEVWDAALVVADRLLTAGATAGDSVGLLGHNSPEFIAGYFGVLAAGCVVIPVPPMSRPAEVVELLRAGGARHLLHDSDLTDLIPTAAVSSLELDFGERRFVTQHTFPVSRSPSDPAVVMFTSGTTGTPKGALLSHLNLVMNATVNAFDLNHFTNKDVVLACLPLFHTYGQTVAMNAVFRAGGRLVLQRRFDGHDALALMREHSVTSFVGVPTMFVRLLEAASDSPDIPSLRAATSGGASLPLAVLERFQDVFGAIVTEGYGLSETSPTCAINQPEIGVRAGTVGHPIWGVDVEIADASIEDRVALLPTGDLGELVIRGHNVFNGYLDNPAATASAIVDGWFRTGDLGRVDADGFISIVDRKKELIIRGGYNVYPREVEEVFARLPGILHVAVIGIPHPVLGEEVCAVIMPADGAILSEVELLEAGRNRLAAHKYPRQVVLVDEMPVGPSQKILKRALVDIVRSKLEGTHNPTAH